MENEYAAQAFLVWCREVAGDVIQLSVPDNLLCRKIERVEITQSQLAVTMTHNLDTEGNTVTEVFYAAANNHQPWCIVSERQEDNQPLVLSACHCVLTLRLCDGRNELIVSPDYDWDD
ncbi:MAG: hypothetical protein H6R25_1376 [Proteobacteria bacterium]|nr:hypothetical protein [Pseudomonadota bacterium]